ncbi:maltose acetyltransferase domain-containing protein [Faecalibacillus intestinalis]|uniref:maltose acetyltransferase domain-containing protein n=2 Tax=Faecalibacillus intestinalis TaxID=1982626 RepID=UPI00352078EC
MKRRILNKELAALVAQIRHGEMIFIADAGSGTSPKAIYPLDPSVQYIDLEAVTGSPSFHDIVTAIKECGDFEGAIVTEDMLELNQKDYQTVEKLFGKENIHVMHYIPEYYQMRDRCKAVVQTGDYGVHAQAILIAGKGVLNMTEKEKMEAGLWYDANNDQELIDQRLVCQDLCFELNQLKPSDEKRNEIIEKILGYFPENLVLLSPFTADYGKNIKLGKNVFVNINNYFMDGASIEIGDHVFIGPSCGFYTANHPLNYTRRNQGLERALPIKVGNNCWFGANVSVMPGVTIGAGCVIAAGAVVTKNMPENSLIAGVPAKVIKTIEQ